MMITRQQKLDGYSIKKIIRILINVLACACHGICLAANTTNTNSISRMYIKNASNNLDLLLCEGNYTTAISPTEADPEFSKRVTCVLIKAGEEAMPVMMQNSRMLQQTKNNLSNQATIRVYAVIPKANVGIIPEVDTIPQVESMPKAKANVWVVPESKAVIKYSIDTKNINVIGNADCWSVRATQSNNATQITNEKRGFILQYTCWIA